ncbi:dihydrodipicolinate synthase/N-acetylneuraminate lyase [Geodermatophilus bullaregiensis]|nr:dihydrodipicolinate synthase/N-acetylneuraminate lyase [Geodermatophilus bullaregiensis]
MGAPGAIAASANLCTQRFVTMIEHGLAGEVAAGRAHAEALLHAEGRIPTLDVRMPLSNASAAAVEHALAVRPV